MVKSLEERFQSVKASMELAGFSFSKEEEHLVLKNARGEISDQQLKNMVLNMIYKGK